MASSTATTTERQITTREGSRVARITTNGRTSRRVAKLIGLQGMSATTINKETGQISRPIDTTFFYNAVASFLASKHFNERRGSVVPGLPALLRECDFYWNYEYRDGQWSALEAVRQLIESIDSAYDNNTSSPQQTNNNTTRTESQAFYQGLKQDTQSLEPFAAYGAYWSRVSQSLSTVTQGLEIPYMTGGSTSAALDNGNPLFARTVPSNDLDARAAILYYQSIGVRHVACLFVKDSWGIHYHASLSKYGPEFGITVLSFAYDPKNIERTILDLRDSQYRYVYAIMHNWKEVLRLAYRNDIVGRPEYVWIAAEEKKMTGDDFFVTERDLAQAVHGLGTINLYFQDNHRFDAAMTEMAFNTALQNEFLGIQANPELFDNYTFPPYDPTGFTNAIFDAVLALGIAACNATLPDLFTGREFHQSLLQTQFEGVSGFVSFNPQTGTRMPEGVQYSLEYVLLSDERTDQEAYRFQSDLVSIINYDGLTSFRPFIYHDNTTIQPPAIPPIAEQELNLLPLWAQIFGYVLAGLVVLCSIGWGVWTAWNRTVFIVKASQPFFLCQLCVGIFIMAMTIVPASLPGASTIHTQSQDYYQQGQSDGDTQGMDIACMSALWLAFIGFCISFSALTSKTHRLNQLMSDGSDMRHVRIEVKHAMAPLYIGLTIHVVFLLCITVVSPLEYQRIHMDNYDGFGRSLESYGTCRPTDNKFYYFLGTLLITDFLSVLAVAWEAYKARGVPTDFSDANSLALCMMSLVETLLVGGPLLLVVQDDPTAVFLVGSSLLSICSLTILFLIFIPKYRGRRRRHTMQSVVVAIHNIRSPSNATIFSSNHLNAPMDSSDSTRFNGMNDSGRMNLVRKSKTSQRQIR